MQTKTYNLMYIHNFVDTLKKLFSKKPNTNYPKEILEEKVIHEPINENIQGTNSKHYIPEQKKKQNPRYYTLNDVINMKRFPHHAEKAGHSVIKIESKEKLEDLCGYYRFEKKKNMPAEATYKITKTKKYNNSPEEEIGILSISNSLKAKLVKKITKRPFLIKEINSVKRDKYLEVAHGFERFKKRP